MTIYQSIFPKVEIPHCTNLGEFLMSGFDNVADNTALVNAETGDSYTFQEVRDRAFSVASALLKKGFRKGDVVTIFSHNNPEYGILTIAVALLGGVTSTMNPLYTIEEAIYQIRDCGTRWLVCAPSNMEIAKAACLRSDTVKEIMVIGFVAGLIPFSTLMEDDGVAYEGPVSVNWKEDIAFLLYSSGTTGPPKGVMQSVYNVVAMLTAIKYMNDLSAASQQSVFEGRAAVLGLLPFFHAAGFTGGIMANLYLGSKLIIIPRFKPKVLLDAIVDHKIKMLAMVPPLVVFLAKHPLVEQYDLSHVETITCGAAPLSKNVTEAAIKRMGGNANLRVLQGYGMTETTLITHFQFPLGEIPAGAVGQPFPNTECKLVNPDTGETVGERNAEGEVWVRGPQIMKGYFNKPEATAHTVDKDGWLHTGDIGYVDDSDNLFIVDRIKELVKYKGHQVAPAELEAVLLKHPGVEDAAVVGVPDEEAGELPKAYVVKKQDQRSAATDEQSLVNYVSEHVAPQSRLRGGVEFIDEIPKTQSGKLMRRILKQRAAAGAALKKSKL